MNAFGIGQVIGMIIGLLTGNIDKLHAILNRDAADSRFFDLVGFQSALVLANLGWIAFVIQSSINLSKLNWMPAMAAFAIFTLIIAVGCLIRVYRLGLDYSVSPSVRSFYRFQLIIGMSSLAIQILIQGINLWYMSAHGMLGSIPTIPGLVP